MVNISSGAESEIKNPENLNPAVFKILVVEDDFQVAAFMEESLKMIPGVEVNVVTDGEDAVEKLRKSKGSNTLFNSVITDLGLGVGKMNGFDLAAIIQRESLSLHVALLTGTAEKINKEYTSDQLREKGVEYLINKPFKLAVLMNYVKGLKNPQK